MVTPLLRCCVRPPRSDVLLVWPLLASWGLPHNRVESARGTAGDHNSRRPTPGSASAHAAMEPRGGRQRRAACSGHRHRGFDLRLPAGKAVDLLANRDHLRIAVIRRAGVLFF